MTIDIVDLPIDSMVIFHSYVNVDQRVLGYTVPGFSQKLVMEIY